MTFHEEYAGIRYEIRKRAQAKKIALKVSHDGRVWVSVPKTTSVKAARAFVESNIAFVQSALESVAAKRESRLAAAEEAQPELIYYGRWLSARIERGEAFSLRVARVPETGGDCLLISVPETEARDEKQARALAMRYWRYAMIQQANAVLPERALELSRVVGEPLRRIAVKNQKSLWGSCVKARRSVNLNWRCILFPDEVRDYLIIHELAHLRHANHSAAYWRQVEEWSPSYRESEKWLKANGRRIMAITADNIA
jgi:predicted metal-dependent hydrolase